MKRAWCIVTLIAVAPLTLGAQATVTKLDPIDSPPRSRDFHKDLLFNFSALGDRGNLVPLLLGAGVAASSRTVDHPVREYFDQEGRWRGFDSVGRPAGEFRVLGPAVAASFLAGRVTGDETFQRFSYSLAQGFVVNSAVTGGLKSTSLRLRPDASNAFSFPSGHTSGAFMWATVVSEHYGWKAALPAYAFASYVGTSRLQSRKHHLSDIVAGATIGFIVGRTVSRTARGENRRIRWNVAVPPGGGAALSLGIRAF